MGQLEGLLCKCGDCEHWEIIRDQDGQTWIVCKTCGDKFKVTFEVEDHEKLHWKPIEAV